MLSLPHIRDLCLTACLIFVFLFLTGELANAIRSRTDLRFGTYHSLFEFFNPLYLRDKANGFITNDFVAVNVLVFKLAKSPIISLKKDPYTYTEESWNVSRILPIFYET